jgi:hypothetical protein
MNPDGTGRAPYSPPWGSSPPEGDQFNFGLLSRDGTRLAYLAGRGPGVPTILRLSNPDGSGSVRIGPADQLHGWSPDGARVAFEPAPDIGDCVQGTRARFTVTRLRGRVRVRTRGRTRTVTQRPRGIANGAVVDARRGSVRLRLSRLTGCTPYLAIGRFAGARFRLATGPGLAGLPNRLRLVGALRGCNSDNGGRTLHVQVAGAFLVRAQRLLAFNTGRARYIVADTCNHTSIVRTRSGRVFAHRGRRVVRVQPGRSYVAKGRR